MAYLTPAVLIRHMYLNDRAMVVSLSFYKPNVNILKRKLLFKAVRGCIDLLIKVNQIKLDRWCMIFSCLEFDFIFKKCCDQWAWRTRKLNTSPLLRSTCCPSNYSLVSWNCYWEFLIFYLFSLIVNPKATTEGNQKFWLVWIWWSSISWCIKGKEKFYIWELQKADE